MYEKISQAQQQAVQKYVAKNYDRMVLTVPKGERDIIKSAAEKAGESMNKYIQNAIYARLDLEGISRNVEKQEASSLQEGD